MDFYNKASSEGSSWGNRIASIPRRVILCICAALIFLSWAGFALSTRSNISYMPTFQNDNSPPPVVQYPITTNVSKVHYLLPASNVKAPLCAAAASAMANRYPAPVVVGYKGEGEFDAHAAHIAKLRVVSRYLHQFKEQGDEHDIVLVMDGFDVLAQAPAEHMIEQYFRVIADKDQKLADRFGISVEEAHARGIRQTLLWGTDKGCFPSRRDEPQCWMIPDSDLDRYLFGPKTMRDGGKDLPFTDSKFLNSGTVMGPLGDLRLLLDDVLSFINATWAEDNQYRNSDQLYISKTYARQEYYRLMDLTSGQYKGPDGLRMPDLSKYDPPQHEFHVTVDFDATFTMTQCHNERFIRKLSYNGIGNKAHIADDWMEEGDLFRPYDIQLPSSLFLGLERLRNAFSGKEPQDRAADARKWIQNLHLGTNVATKKQYAFYHNTCSKKDFVKRYQESWFYPDIRPLLRAGASAIRAGEYINERPIDGRMWKAVTSYPVPETEGEDGGAVDGASVDEYGGIFTDFAGEEFVPFSEFCQESISEIIG